MFSTFLDERPLTLALLWRAAGHRVIAVDVLPDPLTAGLVRRETRRLPHRDDGARRAASPAAAPRHRASSAGRSAGMRTEAVLRILSRLRGAEPAEAAAMSVTGTAAPDPRIGLSSPAGRCGSLFVGGRGGTRPRRGDGRVLARRRRSSSPRPRSSVPRWMTAWFMLGVLAVTVLHRGHPDPLDWHPYLLIAGVHPLHIARFVDARRSRPRARAVAALAPVRRRFLAIQVPAQLSPRCALARLRVRRGGPARHRGGGAAPAVLALVVLLGARSCGGALTVRMSRGRPRLAAYRTRSARGSATIEDMFESMSLRGRAVRRTRRRAPHTNSGELIE